MAKSKSSRGVGLIVGLILVAAVAAFVLSMTWLSGLAKTSTYYVLNQDVPAKAMIYPDMLSPIVTSADTEPMNAITLEEVERSVEEGPPFITQIPLEIGDPVTYSAVGGFKDISAKIPDEWVVTSFGVNADNAVGGRIRAGYYFDILATVEGKTFYPFINVLALDTTVSMDSASSADAVDTEEAYEGQTSQYVVGMTPGDAARLQNLVSENGDGLRLLLSPRQNEYEPPQINDYKGVFTWQELQSEMDVDYPEPIDLGEGTGLEIDAGDRDVFGRPLEVPKNCSKGNSFVAPDENGKCPVEGTLVIEED